MEAAVQAGDTDFGAGAGQRGGFRGGIWDQVEGLVVAGEAEATGGITPGGCDPLSLTVAVDLQLLAEACYEGVGAGFASAMAAPM